MDVESVFETDILRGLIAQIEKISGRTYNERDEAAPAFRVIADHLRCLAFSISDGVQPGNVDRGYVLRKVLRRAVRYGRLLGMEKPFLAQALPQLVATMGQDYPELVKGQSLIAEILTVEEEAFIRTLKRGGNILNQVIELSRAGKIITGDDAFKLKDTYGLPFEEIALIAKDSNLSVDQSRYLELEEEARERSRKVHKNVHQVASETVFGDFIKGHGETKFSGYQETSGQGKILGIFVGEEFTDQIHEGEEGLIILSETPFYAEMGGQVGDTGVLEAAGGQRFIVESCTSPYKGLIVHKGRADKGAFSKDTVLNALVDRERRQKIANNHTATHLLHWALCHILGAHIKQAGSVVEPGRLRFDFNHHKALTAQEIRQIEDLVNLKIRDNSPVRSYELPYEEAQTHEEIKQFFGEKYGNTVRVVDIGYSKELCGGTHTASVGHIGLFRIATESGIAAGVRRIEAVTGKEAEEAVHADQDLLLSLAESLKTQPRLLEERLEKLLEENKVISRELKVLKTERLGSLMDALVSGIDIAAPLPLLVAEIPVSIEELRQCTDQALDRLKSGVVVLATSFPDKCQVVAKVSDDLVKRGYSANDIVKLIAPIIQGSGGGKPNLAQAGGKAVDKLKEALERVRNHLESMR